RETLEIRSIEIHHAHRLAAGRGLERARIQIVHLLRGELGEAATADGTTGDVVRRVVMAGRGHPVADPDAGRRADTVPPQAQVVVLAQRRQAVVHQQRGHVVCRWRRIVQMRGQPVEHVVQGAATHLAVQRGEVVVVERPAGSGRLAPVVLHGAPVVAGAHQGHGRLRRLQPGLHQRPVAGQAREHGRQVFGNQAIDGQGLGAETLQDAYPGKPVEHAQAAWPAACACSLLCFSATSRCMLCSDATSRYTPSSQPALCSWCSCAASSAARRSRSMPYRPSRLIWLPSSKRTSSCTGWISSRRSSSAYMVLAAPAPACSPRSTRITFSRYGPWPPCGANTGWPLPWPSCTRG